MEKPSCSSVGGKKSRERPSPGHARFRPEGPGYNGGKIPRGRHRWFQQKCCDTPILRKIPEIRKPFLERYGLPSHRCRPRGADASALDLVPPRREQGNCVALQNVVFREKVLLLPKWRNWQTRMIQVHVVETPWKFESSLGHVIFPPRDPPGDRGRWGQHGSYQTRRLVPVICRSGTLEVVSERQMDHHRLVGEVK